MFAEWVNYMSSVPNVNVCSKMAYFVSIRLTFDLKSRSVPIYNNNYFGETLYVTQCGYVVVAWVTLR
jgi:hypothetical protein